MELDCDFEPCDAVEAVLRLGAIWAEYRPLKAEGSGKWTVDGAAIRDPIRDQDQALRRPMCR